MKLGGGIDLPDHFLRPPLCYSEVLDHRELNSRQQVSQKLHFDPGFWLSFSNIQIFVHELS